MKSTFKSFIGLGIWGLGQYLAQYVNRSVYQAGFWMNSLGILSFLLILGACLLIISPILDNSAQIDAWIRARVKALQIGIGMSLFILGLSPFIISVLTFYHFIGEYHDDQLKRFGKVTTVYLEGEIWGNRSRLDLYFSFEHAGETWEGMLDSWQYKTGDSVQIIYSTENPNEVEWYEKYLLETVPERE